VLFHLSLLLTWCQREVKETRKIMDIIERDKFNLMTMQEFVDIIKTYESDTFSASGWNPTDEEALSVAQQILYHWVNNKLDGDLLAEVMEDIRGE